MKYDLDHKKVYDCYVQELIGNITPFVEGRYATNDKAHQLDHAITVTEEAASALWWLGESGLLDAKYNRTTALFTLLELVVTAAMYHDIYSSFNRREHHELAREYILETTSYPLCFSKEESLIVANAAQQHRASWKGGYTHVASEVVAAGDRGNPDPDGYVLRSIQYGFESFGYDALDSIVHGLTHIGGKFGSGRKVVAVPEWYHVRYAKEIALSQELFRKCHSTEITRDNARAFALENFPKGGAVHAWIEEHLPS